MSTPYHTFGRWRADFPKYVTLNESGDHVIDDEGVRQIEAELAERQANHEHDERLCDRRAQRIRELEAKLAESEAAKEKAEGERDHDYEILKSEERRLIGEIQASATREAKLREALERVYNIGLTLPSNADAEVQMCNVAREALAAQKEATR